MELKKTTKVLVKELHSLMHILKEKNMYTVSVFTELNDMGANPTLWYIKGEGEYIDINMEKLFLFKIKYGLE